MSMEVKWEGQSWAVGRAAQSQQPPIPAEAVARHRSLAWTTRTDLSDLT